MGDFLDKTRDEIAARMRELEPSVGEYHRLEAAAAALAGLRRSSAPVGTTPKPSDKRAPTTAPRRRAKPRQRAARAPRGARASEALSLLRERPGLRASEVAERIGASRTHVHALLARLEREGKLSRRGRGWHLKA